MSVYISHTLCFAYASFVRQQKVPSPARDVEDGNVKPRLLRNFLLCVALHTTREIYMSCVETVYNEYFAGTVLCMGAKMSAVHHTGNNQQRWRILTGLLFMVCARKVGETTEKQGAGRAQAEHTHAVCTWHQQQRRTCS